LGQFFPILLAFTGNSFLGFPSGLHLGSALGNMTFQQFLAGVFIVQELMQE
jgi:hypothetical protein